MKNAAIITLYGEYNFGNRLQNYAVQEILKQHNIKATTLKNEPVLNVKKNYILRSLKYLLFPNKEEKAFGEKRKENFRLFNQNIQIEKKTFNFWKLNRYQNYDYYFVGSDQIWNPYFGRLRDFDLVEFVDNENKIAFSASFGVEEIPEEYKEKTAQALKKFKAISVREDAGKKIIDGLLVDKEVEVLVDPTMLLTDKKWDKVAKKPIELNEEKYILTYFLGTISEERRREIERIAKENNCIIINPLDKNSKFYNVGPSEFIYLEKNAFLVCTDSFHSCVFAILYHRPFVVFDREDNVKSMNSRLETLLSKFELGDRKFKKEISKELLQCNYDKTDVILEEERKKAENFLTGVL